MTDEYHDGDDGGLPQSQLHAHHHSKRRISRRSGSGQKCNRRSSGQTDVTEQRIEPTGTPSYQTIILRQTDRKRYGQHYLQQPQRRLYGRPNTVFN